MTDDQELTDQQLDFRQRILGRGIPDRPTWDRGYGQGVFERVSKHLHDLTQQLPVRSKVVLGKWSLGKLHGCERNYKATERDFSWSVATARGTVAHKALEWLLSDASAPPSDVSRAALDHLSSGDDGLGTFLRELSLPERHELGRDVTEIATNFITDFPPIPARWYPIPEYPIRLKFGAFSIRATPDLSIGVAQKTTARRILFDFKTGGVQHAHITEASFYALAETLKSKIPPYRVVTYYVRAGDATTTDVDAGVVECGERWLLDGATRMTELLLGSEPSTSPSWLCRNCPVLAECGPGQAEMARHDVDE